MNEHIAGQLDGVHNPQFLPQKKFLDLEACRLSRINEDGWIDR